MHNYSFRYDESDVEAFRCFQLFGYLHFCPFISTCPGVVSRLAAPPPLASRPPLPPRPPLMERMRKIKRQLSLTLGRGGSGGGDRTLSDTITQEATSHSDSGNPVRCEQRPVPRFSAGFSSLMTAALINATHLAAQVQVMLEMRDRHGKLLSTGYTVTIPRRCLEP